MTPIFSIARNALVESLRQPVVVILVLASGVVQAFNTANTGFAMGMEATTEVKGDDKLLLDIGLASVFVLGTLLAGFIATAVMSREIENKTVLTVVSKPIGRPTLVVGKFLGVAGAILLATIPMLIFLLVAIRHGVMSTAADDLDQPVLVFTLSAVGLTLAVGAWCNFYYGWNFPQTVMTLLTPMLLVAFVLILAISKEWKWQPIGHDFKPQVTIACGCLVLAVLVLTSIATAASTRLGQVMTITICVGAFAAALLSNYFVGRHAFANVPIGTVLGAKPESLDKPGLQLDSFYLVTLQNTPGTASGPTTKGAASGSTPAPRADAAVKPGDTFYYSPSPSGYPLLTPAFPPFTGRLDDSNTFLGPDTPGRLIVTKVDGRTLTIRHVGGTPLPIARPPEPGDTVFTTPTRTNYAALGLWGAVPNLHFFWLLDAVSQNRPVPPEYLATATLYAGVQIVAFLSLAVILFQKRDVG